MSSDEADWVKLLHQKPIHGINLYANNNWSRIIHDRFNTNSYPTYILVSPDGKVYDPYAKWPSVRWMNFKKSLTMPVRNENSRYTGSIAYF